MHISMYLMQTYLSRWRNQTILFNSFKYMTNIYDKEIETSVYIFVLGSADFGPGLPVHALPTGSQFYGVQANPCWSSQLSLISSVAGLPCLPRSLPFRKCSLYMQRPEQLRCPRGQWPWLAWHLPQIGCPLKSLTFQPHLWRDPVGGPSSLWLPGW